MLKLDPTKGASDFWQKLEAKQYKQIGNKILSLLADPFPPDCLRVKGYEEELFRVHSGEYRIIYKVEEKTLKLVLIGKRNDNEVYKQLERKS